jgi:hypothetical protein
VRVVIEGTVKDRAGNMWASVVPDSLQLTVDDGKGDILLPTERLTSASHIDPEFIAGRAYVDGDGDWLLRTDDDRWIDYEGDYWDHDGATRPVRAAEAVTV